MKFDIILSGVGGQGVLSIGAIIAKSALKSDIYVKQSEIHGMAQRGGAVLSHLRLSDGFIYSDLIAKASAQLLLSVEPLESLRYINYLAPEGTLITATSPVKNITHYPEESWIFNRLNSVKHHLYINAQKLAKDAGSNKAQNMVMVGAASVYLPIKENILDSTIEELFRKKDPKTIDINKKAFLIGKESALNQYKDTRENEQ